MTGGRSGQMSDPPVEPGWVFWITGLAGAGKTTVAQCLVDRLRAVPRPVVLLDGDELRATFEHEFDYTLDGRRRAARRYSRLARLVAAQGVDVVVATISMFHACHAWNRRNCPRYFEVYLRASPTTLVARTRSRRSRQAEADTTCNIVGRDLAFEEPVAADLIVETEAFADGAAVGLHVWDTLRSHVSNAEKADHVGLH